MNDLKTVREYVQPHRYHHYTAGVVIDLIIEVQAETLEWAADKTDSMQEDAYWNRLNVLAEDLRSKAEDVRGLQ